MSASSPVQRSAEEVLAALRRILTREFDLSEAEVRPESHLVDDLDLDSIDAVDLAVKVEEALGFQFEPDDLRELVTLQDVIDVIRGRPPHASPA